MPYRTTILTTGEIYHVFNRGVARMPIFTSFKDYAHFLELIDYYRFANLPTSYSNLKKTNHEDRKKIIDGLKKNSNSNIEVLAFCLMNNHFHLLIKQTGEKGIQKFMTDLQNSYAKYFNIKSERLGPLFQSSFKAVRIETDEQLLHVSRYIHLNPSTSFLVKVDALIKYPWSSLPNYSDNNFTKNSFVISNTILSYMRGNDSYMQFVFDQAKYQKELYKIKHLILD